jgi:hypothetical protein
MQLSRIFLVCFVLGIAGGYVFLRRPAPPAAPQTAAGTARPEPATSLNDPLIAKRPHSKESLAEVETRPPIASLNVTRPEPVAPEVETPPAAVTETGQIRARAEELAGAESMDPEQARVMLEQALTGKLPKEPSPREYDQIAQAFLRARAAERVLSGLDETPATELIREEYREALNESVSQIEGITGLKAAQLKPLIDPQTRSAEQDKDEGTAEEPER